VNEDPESKDHSTSNYDASRLNGLGISPRNVADLVDPGDETQRNFRYQHSFGLVLIVQTLLKLHPYVALWCEHHEDFMCERVDGLFDAYQIKTRKPENGAWKMSDNEIRQVFSRFCSLCHRFPRHIQDLYFVSNAECYDTQSLDESHKSPIQIKLAATQCESIALLPEKKRQTIEKLAADIEVSVDAVLDILRKTKFVKSMPREGFDAIIAHDYLRKIDFCAKADSASLDTMRDLVVATIFRSSSLQTNSIEQYWVSSEGQNRPSDSKRLIIDDLCAMMRNCVNLVPFTYLPIDNELNLGSGSQKSKTIHDKLEKAGLADHILTMTRRALSAEYKLIERMHLNQSQFNSHLNQITAFVQGECDDAALKFADPSEIYGPAMLRDVQERLRIAADVRPGMVGGEPYECLIGVAGLLTGECSVWWGPKFQIGDKQ
jgi:hypothetical protein